MKLPLLTALGLLCMIAAKSQPGSDKVKALLAQMSLEEKVQLLVGRGMKLPGMPTFGGPTVGATLDKVPGAAGTSYAIPRLGIPTTVFADGPAGVRISPYRNSDSSQSYFATAFPVATLLASSWDTALLKNVGEAMGNELKSYGIDFLLAPGMNIHRNPLGGRNFEYYSEDPLVTGLMAAAMVNGIQKNGVGASIKHFAANEQETNRNQINTIVSERALREIYLKGFEIAVKRSSPWTVMSAYNRINGTYASESHDLLTTILRKEWGFKGLVMTDWFGGSNAELQIKAGNDLLMPGTPQQAEKIMAAVKSGTLSEAVINENAGRVLSILLKTPAFQKYEFTNRPDLKAHAVLARQAAADGIVLLQNHQNTLPLATGLTLAAFGNTSYDYISGGTGSGDVNEAYTISLVQGLQNADYTLNPALQQQYEAFITKEKASQPAKKFFFELPKAIPEMPVSAADLETAAQNANAAIITIGRNSGEFQDRKQEDDFLLTAAEKNLIATVSGAFKARGKKVIVILNTGGVIETASWRNLADAILLPWQGGQEAGNAVADVLCGKVNPSGRLATTFPLAYNDVPSAGSFPGKNLSETDIIGPGGIKLGRASEVVYNEGIFVGYRYYGSYKKPVAYPFGFGLSYTSFSISAPLLQSRVFAKSITVTGRVTNTGKTAGRQVVQLYLTAPALKMAKPGIELKAFAKTRRLKPGESETVKFTLTPADLASFDSEASCWMADAGDYTIRFGNSSADLLPGVRFNLAKTIRVEKVNKVLVPQVQIEELGSL